MAEKRLVVLGSFCVSLLLLAATAAYGVPLTLTPVAPNPGPSFNDGTQFGSMILGPVTVPISGEEALFSGTLVATAFQNPTSITFVYRITMDVPSDQVDTFELATLFPPDLAIDAITAVGYNTYYTGLNPDAAPCSVDRGSDDGFTYLDFGFTNPDAGDYVGLPPGCTTEIFVTTTNDVDINVVYAVFLNSGAAVEETVGSVVAPGPPPENVPEPATAALVISGLVGIAGIVRSKVAR